nr:flavin reductase family protein [Prevotella sp. 10(H)]
MKKNLGSTLALYPTPAVVIGTMIEEKVNWVLVGHIGIIGHDLVMISLHKSHHTNKGILETGQLSVNVIDENMLQRADYVGIVSGTKVDKSEVFAYQPGEARAPIIDDSPLVMECEVLDNYQTETFDNFICKINNTYADTDILNEKGNVDYSKLKPVLFEMPGYNYLRTGDVIGKCTTLGKEYKNELK